MFLFLMEFFRVDIKIIQINKKVSFAAFLNLYGKIAARVENTDGK